MKKDFVIIGGGVAGLCAAIRLSELGADPLLIEAGEYPAHKVCGEFFSPDVIPVLARWGIHPIEIKQVCFHTAKQTLSFSFPTAAGSLSHLEVDPQLAKIAALGGAQIQTKTKVIRMRPHPNYHEIELSSGEVVQAKHLILAAGRFPQVDQIKASAPDMPYIGIKAHFEGISWHETLEMFALKGLYLGISPIENKRFNVACLVSKDLVKQCQSTEAFIASLMTNRLLESRFSKAKCLFSEWMSCPIPNFGIKKTPHWPHSYFIGDAAGTIPPITGNGLSMAIKGGILAAEYALNNNPEAFKVRWKKEFSSAIFWGKFLHRVALQPFLLEKMIALGNFLPILKHSVYKLTR